MSSMPELFSLDDQTEQEESVLPPSRRPRKDGLAENLASGMKKPRGRPRKRVAPESSTVAATQSGTPAIANNSRGTLTSGTKKPRGRPRKPIVPEYRTIAALAEEPTESESIGELIAQMENMRGTSMGQYGARENVGPNSTTIPAPVQEPPIEAVTHSSVPMWEPIRRLPHYHLWWTEFSPMPTAWKCCGSCCRVFETAHTERTGENFEAPYREQARELEFETAEPAVVDPSSADLQGDSYDEVVKSQGHTSDLSIEDVVCICGTCVMSLPQESISEGNQFWSDPFDEKNPNLLLEISHAMMIDPPKVDNANEDADCEETALWNWS